MESTPPIVTSRKIIDLFLVLIVRTQTTRQWQQCKTQAMRQAQVALKELTTSSYTIDDLPSTFSSNTLLKICSNLTMDNNLISISFGGLWWSCTEVLRSRLVFTDMHNLELHNLTIDGCGLLTDVDTDPLHNIKASLTIMNSTNISLVNITIIIWRQSMSL